MVKQGQGLGKPGQGLGGMRRHQKVLRDNIMGFADTQMKALVFYYGGGMKTSGQLYEQLRVFIKGYTMAVLHKALLFMENAKRKTIMYDDIKHALEMHHQSVVGDKKAFEKGLEGKRFFRHLPTERFFREVAQEYYRDDVRFEGAAVHLLHDALERFLGDVIARTSFVATRLMDHVILYPKEVKLVFDLTWTDQYIAPPPLTMGVHVPDANYEKNVKRMKRQVGRKSTKRAPRRNSA